MSYTYGLPPVSTGYPYTDPLSFGSLNSYGAPKLSYNTGPQLSSLAPVTSPVPMTKPAEIGQAAQAAAVGADAQKGNFWGKDGFNLGSVGDIASIIGGFGTLWSGIQANKLAKDAFNFQKEAFQTNLANQISSYNTSLEDRIRARYSQNNRSQAEADAYIADHRLGA